MRQYTWLAHSRPMRHLLVACGVCYAGEIALLRQIPRVVTITATSHLETRILHREEFLAAVTGNPESVDCADEVISTWLGSG